MVKPPSRPLAARERLMFLWVVTLGMLGTLVLFVLEKPGYAFAFVSLTTSILGMMGWRQAQPLPPGGATVVLTAGALEQSGLGQVVGTGVTRPKEP